MSKESAKSCREVRGCRRFFQGGDTWPAGGAFGGTDGAFSEEVLKLFADCWRSSFLRGDFLWLGGQDREDSRELEGERVR